MYYDYDQNGNAIIDGRTGFHFDYNVLNLPQQVRGTNNKDLVAGYTYDATGNKLKKITPAGTINYIGGIQYKADNSIDFIQTEEGLARNNGSGNYSYEYNLGDHLGNNSVSFYQNPVNQQLEVLQRDDYYAFGIRKNTPFGNNKYLYNGKELQEELGQYDYGARFYDPVVGWWNAVDPLAEKFISVNPYNYTDNNPVNNIDPNGKETYYGAQAQDMFRQLQSQMSSNPPDEYLVDSKGKKYKNRVTWEAKTSIIYIIQEEKG